MPVQRPHLKLISNPEPSQAAGPQPISLCKPLNYPHDSLESILVLSPDLDPRTLITCTSPNRTNIFSGGPQHRIPTTAIDNLKPVNPEYVYLYDETGALTGIHDPNGPCEPDPPEQTVVSLEEHSRRRRNESDRPYWQGPLRCLNCQSTWIGCGPRASENFECPSCSTHCGVHDHPFGSPSDSLTLSCASCGSYTFSLVKETHNHQASAICLRCGANIRDF